MDVKDCMTKNVCCCTPNTNVAEVAKLMCDNHIGCVPVCDEDNKVVGVLTDRDVILRSISCNKDVNTTPVSEVMTCGVCCCKNKYVTHYKIFVNVEIIVRMLNNLKYKSYNNRSR